MLITTCGPKKDPKKSQGSALAEHNSKTTNAPALADALKKGPNGSIRLALTTKEAAAALGISVRSLYRIAERHLLRPSRALRTKTWPVAELLRFLEQTAA